MIVYQIEYSDYDCHSNEGLFATYEAAEKALSVIVLEIKKKKVTWKKEEIDREINHYDIVEHELQPGVEY